MKNYPSRLLIKLVKGNPKEEIKNMMGVYKIIAEYQCHSRISEPIFIHSTDNFRRLFFSTVDKCWKLEVHNYGTIMKWPGEKNGFNDESWSKLNGTATLTFATEKFTLRMISF